MMSPPTIPQISYTLGQLAFYYKYSPPTTAWSQCLSPLESKSDLRILNFLSLLLTTGGPADRAAVSFSYTKDMGLQLFYSKCHPCSNEETYYVTQIFAIATNPQLPLPVKHNDLFHLAVMNCKAKISSRLHKASSCLKDLSIRKDFGILDRNSELEHESNSKPTPCDEYIRRYVDPEMFPNGSSLPQFLKKWFYSFLDTFGPDSSFVYPFQAINITRTLHVCYFLVVHPETRKILDPDLYYRLQKLAEYRPAIAAVIGWMGRFDSEALSTLKVTEIVPSPTSSVDVSGNFLQILDKYARYTGSVGVTDKDLCTSYGRMRSFPVSLENKITLHSHSGCFLALALAKRFFATTIPIVLNIGCAKPMCWICLEYLATIHHCYPHITICTTPNNRRINSTWMIPPGTPCEVATTMYERLGTALNSVITTCGSNSERWHNPLSETEFADSMQYWISICKDRRLAMKP
ncbi:hypothetical protein B9Z19DRAFT_1106184 [Tuber borchii]|uniref:Uncharacterized protein n=1 Tax=Tuber borchii TaxID=42251 RepID=A0A2T7A252_TUBBO|nr:hypothetical protein B9Z19DRAFT_1106184 [Tuber borchii]